MSFLKRATVLLNALSLSSALNTVAVSPTDWSVYFRRNQSAYFRTETKRGHTMV